MRNLIHVPFSGWLSKHLFFGHITLPRTSSMTFTFGMTFDVINDVCLMIIWCSKPLMFFDF